MAKQVATQNTEVEPQKEIVKQVFTKKIEEPIAPSWEIKDRTYFLLGGKSPLTHTIPSKHTRKYSLLWFDSETGEQEELRYATNQTSPLVSKQKGEVTLGHIMFKNGTLTVPAEQQNLQKLLALYHPMLNKKYREFDAVLIELDELDYLEKEIEALTAASGMDVDQAEAILRVELGSKVSKMTSKEIKRYLLIFAKRNPVLFLDLVNDENIQLRNFAIKACEANIIKLSPDQRDFKWAANGKKLMTVPFDENPYSAMAAFFKTDEGIEIFQSIEKKLQ
jgi:hypothetical protein